MTDGSDRTAGTRTRVALFFGGANVEHEISVVSARSVAAGFDPDRFEVVPIAVTTDGRWWTPERSAALLADPAATRVEPRSASEPAFDGGVGIEPGRGLVTFDRAGVRIDLRVDVGFPLIHGRYGEDGSLQGVLETAGIPYVGAGVTGSAVAFDKAFARALVERAGVPLVPWSLVGDGDAIPAATEVRERVGLPCFVKPANGGSSVGIRKVDGADGIRPAIEHAREFDRRVVIEAAIDGREIEVAVFGNDRPRASLPGEVVPAAEFYTYDDKYHDGRAELHVPAGLDEATTAAVRDHAVRAYRALDLAGMARVDFFVERGTGRILFNEANTIPGFTPISMYAKLWEVSGLPYGELLASLVDAALDRARVSSAICTARPASPTTGGGGG